MAAIGKALPDRWDSVEPDKSADLLERRGDPGNAPNVAREIDMIMSEGRLSDGATLDQLRPERIALETWGRTLEAVPMQWLPEAH